jgi:hypothetical protein
MPEARTDSGAALVYCRVPTSRSVRGIHSPSQAALGVTHADRLSHFVARVTWEVW